MSERIYSRDIWDYLGDMPYLPRRQDRDVLVEAVSKDATQTRRAHIWDYFFRINPDDLGRPQKEEIELLGRQREAEIKATQTTARRRQKTATRTAVIGIVCSLLFFCPRDLAGSQVSLLLGLGTWLRILPMCGAVLFLVGVFYYALIERELKTELGKIESRIQQRIEYLQKTIEALKRRIPNPPSDMQVHSWLQDDMEWLAQRAKENTGLESRLIDLKDAPNPLCILGPAELQDRSLIPQPFLDERDDRKYHLEGRHFAVLPDGRFEDFYGVYYVHFILVASDMLGHYGCYFDFITGNLAGERTSEQYYHDVVSLSTHRQYRQVEVGSLHIVIENAPTFEMSLASGERIEVTFASTEYFLGIRTQVKDVQSPSDPKSWVRNPETIAENAIRALRSRLRKHKGVPGESLQR